MYATAPRPRGGVPPSYKSILKWREIYEIRIGLLRGNVKNSIPTFGPIRNFVVLFRRVRLERHETRPLNGLCRQALMPHAQTRPPARQDFEIGRNVFLVHARVFVIQSLDAQNAKIAVRGRSLDLSLLLVFIQHKLADVF